MSRIVLFLGSAFLPVAVAFTVWWSSLGYYQPAEHWVADALLVKETRARSITQPKLLIVAGSNALFGIDSENLASLIGRPVVNLATHAGLPLAFHIDEALKSAKRGDIVLMPLEFQYYADTGVALSSWQVSNLSSWGYRFIEADPMRALQYFRHASIADVVARLEERKPIPADPDEVILSTTAANSAAVLPRWMGYSYRSMNAAGDIVAGEGPTIQANTNYTDGNASQFAISQLKSFKETLAERGVGLQLTWPVMMRNPLFDLGVDRSTIDRLRRTLALFGLEITCEPLSFQFERRLFLNTEYHLGAEGTQLRTAALASCLNGTHFDAATGQALYSERLAQAGQASADRRRATLADLTSIVSALGKFRDANGHYPVRAAWDGFYSIYGPSGADWIPGLVPRFIAELPRDRRMHNHIEAQYLYRSDGVDFKLIAANQPDCERYRALRSDIVDPKRDCNSVGFWTPGARDW